METSPRESPFFKSYLDDQERRSRNWVLPVILAVVVLIGVIAGAFLVRPNPNQFSVVTPKGMRLVKIGMSESQVGEVLGKPISSSQQGSEYCVRYGTPTLKKPQFLLYDACYENGTLKRFTPKKFSAEKVER